METDLDEHQSRLATEGYARRLRRHTSELVRLALPIMASRSGFLLLIMADTIMTGQYAAHELAYLTIGLGIFMPMMIISLGLIMGTMVLIANALGAGRKKECGRHWRRAMQYSLMLSVIGVVVGLSGETLLQWAGQDADIAKGGGKVVAIVCLGLPGHLLFLSSSFFLEAIGRPTPSMLVMIAANVLNVALNGLFIYGGFGLLEPMGAAGAALATTIVRWGMAISLGLVVWYLPNRDEYAIREPLEGGFESWRDLRRTGYGIGAGVGVEAIAFSIMNMLAGWLGAMPLAAYGLSFNLMALVFMMAVGVGAATAVRVGIAHGRGDAPDTALAGWTGLGASVALMGAVSIVFAFWSEPLAQLYTEDPVLLVQAAIAIKFMRWTSIPDGAQVTMSNALRAVGDVWSPVVIQTISYFVFMLPIAYVLTFTMGGGLIALYEAMLVGGVVSMVCQAARFRSLTRRAAARMHGAP